MFHVRVRPQNQVTATIQRGRVKRAFVEWRNLAKERWWKNQLLMRDETIHALEVSLHAHWSRAACWSAAAHLVCSDGAQ